MKLRCLRSISRQNAERALGLKLGVLQRVLKVEGLQVVKT